MKCQIHLNDFGIYFRFYKVCTKIKCLLQNIYKNQKLKIEISQLNEGISIFL